MESYQINQSITPVRFEPMFIAYCLRCLQYVYRCCVALSRIESIETDLINRLDEVDIELHRVHDEIDQVDSRLDSRKNIR